MLPFSCKYCGGSYCANHRLPEYHECTGLTALKERGWVAPSIQPRRGSRDQRSRKMRLPRIQLPVQGNYAYIIIGLCFVVYLLQFAVPIVTGFNLTNSLTLSSGSVFSRPWTLVTSMFLHDPGNMFHILFNMLMLFFFGPLLERHIGSGKFLWLYLGSGILAGLAQVMIFPGSAVLGASGAIMGVMGALCALMPDLRIYLYFVPMKLVYAVIIFAAIDLILLPTGDGIAHGAHLIGLFVGLVFGFLIKKSKGTVHAYWHV